MQSTTNSPISCQENQSSYITKLSIPRSSEGHPSLFSRTLYLTFNASCRSVPVHSMEFDPIAVFSSLVNVRDDREHSLPVTPAVIVLHLDGARARRLAKWMHVPSGSIHPCHDVKPSKARGAPQQRRLERMAPPPFHLSVSTSIPLWVDIIVSPIIEVDLGDRVAAYELRIWSVHQSVVCVLTPRPEGPSSSRGSCGLLNMVSALRQTP